jgi:hypothetical protein
MQHHHRYHPGLPPNSDGAKSWSQDLPYNDFPNTGVCTSDYFEGESLVCPDNGPPEKQTDYRNFLDLKSKARCSGLRVNCRALPLGRVQVHACSVVCVCERTCLRSRRWGVGASTGNRQRQATGRCDVFMV